LKKIIFIFLLSINLNAFAQRIDIGFGLGLAKYWGDLAPSIAFYETKFASNVFA